MCATLPEASAAQPPCQTRKHCSVDGEERGLSTDLKTITVHDETPQVGDKVHEPFRGLHSDLAPVFAIPRVEAESAQALEQRRINLQVALRWARTFQ